jgi:F0F1-type ATP synthase assembly protein I
MIIEKASESPSPSPALTRDHESYASGVRLLVSSGVALASVTVGYSLGWVDRGASVYCFIGFGVISLITGILRVRSSSAAIVQRYVKPKHWS